MKTPTPAARGSGATATMAISRLVAHRSGVCSYSRLVLYAHRSAVGPLPQFRLPRQPFGIWCSWMSTSSTPLIGPDRYPTFDAVSAAGRGTVTDSDMPFVNREEELWRIFEINAEAYSLLRSLKTKPTSSHLRNCNLLFCKQYFGGGKTTLGDNFGKDRKSTRLNSSHRCTSRMPSSA